MALIASMASYFEEARRQRVTGVALHEELADADLKRSVARLQARHVGLAAAAAEAGKPNTRSKLQLKAKV